MGSVLAKFAASEYAGHVLEENFGPENPRYDFLITDSGRRKKIPKPTPPGLSPWDDKILKSVRKKAWRYEWWVDCHCCCGLHLQFGTATLWGLLPVVGDFISLLNALALIRAARRIEGGLPAGALAVMLAWAAVDFVIKLVPVLGEVITAVVKPNTRNVMRVEGVLRSRGERRLRREEEGRIAVRVPGRGAGAAEPLLVGAQPEVQRGMRAGPAYGAAAATAVPAERSGAREERQGRRSLLPFWRRNEDSDSDDDSGRAR